MSEEKLLSKDTFIDLFSKKDIERIEMEDLLYLEARKLGLEKKFTTSLKKYEKLFSEKIALDNEKKLPANKYELEKFDTGKYVCTVDGIIDSKKEIKFSYMPVFPVEKYVNKDTGKEKVKIVYYKENEWKEKLVDRSQLAINQKLLQLSDIGLDVNSENVKYFINYFNEVMNLNEINTLESVSHLGWDDNKFIPYDIHGIFDGADDYKPIYRALSSKGNYDKWLNATTELRKHKTIKLLMAATLASPLLEKIDVQPYIVNLWSSMSGNGKTLACMVAMSIWGNPAEGALRLSSNSTRNFYVSTASFMRNITCYFDELQMIKNSKDINMDNLIMDLCNGTEKGRLNKNSETREVKVWYNNFLFTSNDRLVKENAGEHVYNRVIDLEVSERLVEDGHKIAEVIRNNYGFAGKKFMEYVEKKGFEEINKRFGEIYEELMKTNATSKQANALASILLANELANECIFQDDYILQVNDIVEYINDKDEIKTSIKAKEYIINIISANENKFDENNRYGECWGKIEQKYKENKTILKIKFNINILFKELEKGGFDFNTVKKEWADEGFLEKNSQNKYYHQTTVNHVAGQYVVFIVPEIDERT